MARIVVRSRATPCSSRSSSSRRRPASSAGVLFVYAGDLPQISALDDYAPSTITRVYAADGAVVGEFATERRVVIGYDEISPRLRQAIIAAEDEEFDQHFGLQHPAHRDRARQGHRRAAARRPGASTLTQQLARNLFLTGSRRPGNARSRRRSLAIQIEKRYTKREILTLYANQIYLGHGAYGVEAASRLYFGKSAQDLTLEEAALIAGIIQTPEPQSPYVEHGRRACAAATTPCTRMADEGYITQAEADAARKTPDRHRRAADATPSSIAPYFVEEVRKHLEAKYGAKQLYENGLTVRTALDRRPAAGGQPGPRATACARSTSGAASASPRGTCVAEAQTIADASPSRAGTRPMRGRRRRAGGRDRRRAAPRHRRAARRAPTAPIEREGFAWTRRPTPTRSSKRGDLVEVRVDAVDDGDRRVRRLRSNRRRSSKAPSLAIDNRTGQVLAMVGGFSFERSKFNRAMQA